MPTQIIDITGSGMSQQQENDLNEAKNKSEQNEQNITQLQNDCNNCKNYINQNAQNIAQHTQNISDINALAASAKTKADDAFTLAQSAQGGGGNSSSVEVYDGLDSDDSTKALSAKQGKVLNETKLGINDKSADSDKLNGQDASYYGKQSDVQQNTNNINQNTNNIQTNTNNINQNTNNIQTNANNINALQQDSHTHSNKSTLDKLGENNGDLTYNGNVVGGSGSGINVYDVADKAARDALTNVNDGDVVRYNDAFYTIVETRINGEWQRDWIEENKNIKMHYRVKTSNPPSEDDNIGIKLVDDETDVYDIWTKPDVSLTSMIITSKLSKSKTTEIKVIKHEYNSLYHTFSDFNVMTLFDVEHNNVFDNVVDMIAAWASCFALTSFPRINTSNVTNMNSTWYNCSSLTSFPQIDTSNVTNMYHTWYDCASLTSFPQINTSNVINMQATWDNCTNIDHFEELDTRLAAQSGNISNVFDGCNNLQHPTTSEINDLTDNNGAHWTLADGIVNSGN